MLDGRKLTKENFLDLLGFELADEYFTTIDDSKGCKICNVGWGLPPLGVVRPNLGQVCVECFSQRPDKYDAMLCTCGQPIISLGGFHPYSVATHRMGLLKGSSGCDVDIRAFKLLAKTI